MDIRALVNTILEMAERLVERNVRASDEDEYLRNTEKMIIILVLLYWVEGKIRYDDVWQQDIVQLFELTDEQQLNEYEILKTVNKLYFAIRQRAHMEQSEMIRDILSQPNEFPLSFRAYKGLRKDRRSDLIYYASVIVYYRIADYIMGVNQFPVLWTATCIYRKPKKKTQYNK